MPQRFLRPGITNSERWNAVSWDCQSFYIRILTLVDDFGQYDARPAVLWGQCFQIWNEMHQEAAVELQQVARMLQQLAATKLVEIRVTKSGKRFLQVVQWQERIRVGCVPKWSEGEAGEVELQQLAATCSKSPANVGELLPPTPTPTPTPTPSPVVETVGKKLLLPQTDDEWIQDLQRNPVYAGINVREQYGRMDVWCQANKKQTSRKRFVNWLNRCERPMTTTGDGAATGELSASEKILRTKDLDRVEERRRIIRSAYGDHQTWSPEDVQEYRTLKNRREILRKMLGLIV